jgi:hypothetical protein
MLWLEIVNWRSLAASSPPGLRTPNSWEEDSPNDISFLFSFDPDFSAVFLTPKKYYFEIAFCLSVILVP